MAFWSAYQASKRPPEVEELSDRIQRPLGYLLAKLAFPTPLTPNAITVLSMLFAVAAAASWFAPFRYHLPIGGALLFASAIFDAADGQLARMRGTQSEDGRMLDGVADSISAVAAVSGAIWVMWCKFSYDLRIAGLVAAAGALTAYTGSLHTALNDHYKNVWLSLAQSRIHEGEDYAHAHERFRERKLSLVMRFCWAIYLGYVKNQGAVITRFDPHTRSVNDLPPYDAVRAEIYRRRTATTQALWQLYGFGTVIIGIAVSAAFNVLEYYMALRLFVLHPLFWLYLRPLQRRRSREAFAEMGVAAAELD